MTSVGASPSAARISRTEARNRSSDVMRQPDGISVEPRDVPRAGVRSARAARVTFARAFAP
jgi:hypothetical protein